MSDNDDDGGADSDALDIFQSLVAPVEVPQAKRGLSSTCSLEDDVSTKKLRPDPATCAAVEAAGSPQLSPLTWAHRLQDAFIDLGISLATMKPVIVNTVFSGLGTATLALKVGQGGSTAPPPAEPC